MIPFHNKFKFTKIILFENNSFKVPSKFWEKLFSSSFSCSFDSTYAFENGIGFLTKKKPTRAAASTKLIIMKKLGPKLFSIKIAPDKFPIIYELIYHTQK
jgi:hypothetical protein